MFSICEEVKKKNGDRRSLSRAESRKKSTNRYGNLAENDKNDKNDHELIVQAQVEKAVSEALKNVKVGDSTNDMRLKTNGDSHAFNIGRIIAQVITAIEPLLVTACKCYWNRHVGRPV